MKPLALLILQAVLLSANCPAEKPNSLFISVDDLNDWAPYNGKESEMSDSKAADRAVERLQKKHSKPFILMVGFLRPHVPWHVPQKYFDMYDREKIITPPYKEDDLDDVSEAARKTINDGYPRTEWAKKENQWKHIVQSYLASITFVDDKVGQVLDALEASPYPNYTTVLKELRQKMSDAHID